MLTKDEMLTLKQGERVRFSDGVEGTVVAANKHCVTFDWDDGQLNSSISIEDGAVLSRVRDHSK